MMQVKKRTVLRMAKAEKLTNTIDFERKGKKFSTTYCTDSNKWFLLSTYKTGTLERVAEIIP